MVIERRGHALRPLRRDVGGGVIVASEIDELLEEIRARRAEVLSRAPEPVDWLDYDSDVSWLLNYVDMLRAELRRKQT